MKLKKEFVDEWASRANAVILPTGIRLTDLTHIEIIAMLSHEHFCQIALSSQAEKFKERFESSIIIEPAGDRDEPTVKESLTTGKD